MCQGNFEERGQADEVDRPQFPDEVTDDSWIEEAPPEALEACELESLTEPDDGELIDHSDDDASPLDDDELATAEDEWLDESEPADDLIRDWESRRSRED